MNGLLTALTQTLQNLGWETAVIALGGMVTMVAAAAGVRALIAPPPDEIIDRLDRVVGRAAPAARASEAGRPTAGAGLGRKLLRALSAMVRPSRTDELSRLRLRLVQAGLRGEHAMELLLASKLLLAAAATLTFLYVNGRLVEPLTSPLDAGVAVWLCGAGFLVPSLWLGGRIRARQRTLEQALPEAMDLLVTCVESGLGMDAAMSRVAEEIKLASPLLAEELNLTFLEVQANVARRDAFRRLADRTGVDDLRQLSAMLAQTELFGTSIAKALRVHADGMRIRRMQRAEERAATVGVKMTLPLILFILPSLIAVVLGPAIVSIAKHLLKEGQ